MNQLLEKLLEQERFEDPFQFISDEELEVQLVNIIQYVLEAGRCT